jgi:DNA-binding CsgD family transcriptional regulator
MLSAELVEKQQVLLKAIRAISEVKDLAHSDISEKVHSLHTELQQSVISTPEQQSVADSLRHIDDNLAYALLKICPQLTPMELKICSLLKLHLSTKQVAGLLHTSVRNIENHRYRIRKKLFLQTEEHLPTFFARIAHLWHDKK